MNVMAYAHKQVKAMIAHRIKLKLDAKPYRDMLSSCLKVAHQRYKEMVTKMQTVARDLFKIRCLDTRNVVAMITAPNLQAAFDMYKAKGGKGTTCFGEKISNGYPIELCEIYA